jgi:hypothetical protein
MSASDFTVAKVVKAVQTMADGSKHNKIAAQLPDGSLSLIANLDGHKNELERLAEDSKMDLNYAAFQVIEGKVFYVPVEDLHNIVKKT